MNSVTRCENGRSNNVRKTLAVMVGLLSFVFLTGYSCVDEGRFLVTENERDEDHPAVSPSTHRQEYLVVWEDDTDDVIAGRIVSPFDESGPIQALSNGGPKPNVDDPDVSYNSWTREYLVVWENIADKDATDVPDLYGVLADSDGAPLGDPFVIDDTDCGAEDPNLAFSPLSNRWMVVWTHSASPTCTEADAEAEGVDGVFVGADGSIEGDVFDISETVENEKDDADVAYDMRNHQYVAVWRENMADGDHIRGRRTSLFGDTLGTEMNVGGDDSNRARNASIAYGRRGRMMVVYDNSGDFEATMVRALRGGTDTLGPEVEVSVDGTDPSDPAIAYHRDHRAFVVIWEDEDLTQDDYQDIWGRYVKTDGTPKGDVFEVAAGIDDEDLSSSIHHNIECARMFGPCLAVWELGFNPEDLEGRFIE